MGRSHAWLPRGTELIEPRPRHWGDNLTRLGAIRLARWRSLGTSWGGMTTRRFVMWVRRRLLRHLRRRLNELGVSSVRATVVTGLSMPVTN